MDISRLAAWNGEPAHPDQQRDQAGEPVRRQAPAVLGRTADTRRPTTASTRRAPYTGPELSLSPRVWQVLEPVRDLLPAISPFMLRKAAKAIGTELGRGTDPGHVERIRRRIESRRAALDSGRPRDPGAWLLHAAIVRWGCGLELCEEGRLYRPWAPAPGPPIECDVCAEQAARRRLARLQHRRLAAGLCPHHGTPPTRSGACPGCVVDRTTGVPPPRVLPCPEPERHPEAS